MLDAMVLSDETANYTINEAPVLVAALAFVIALGGVVAAAIILCGWRGARQVSLDWVRGKATFYCR